MDAEVDRHFACCTHFIVIDPQGTQVLVNEGRGAGPMAGPDAARMLIENRVTDVITGNIGPKTFEMLNKAGIAVHAGCSGKIQEALSKCARNTLTESRGATFLGHLI